MNDVTKVNLLSVLTKLEGERLAALGEQREAKERAIDANLEYKNAEEKYRRLCTAVDSITDVLGAAGVANQLVKDAIDAADPDPLPEAIDPGECPNI